MAHERALSLGRLPYRSDERDFLLRDHDRFKALYSLSDGTVWWGMDGKTMRIDQGQEGTCVGHGCTNVLMDAPIQHPTFQPFDNPTDAHKFARQLYYDATHDDTYQQGAYTRDALNVLVARGQIGSYHRITSVDEIRTTLLGLAPVVFGSTWYNPMFSPVSEYGNSYLKVDPNGGVAGGHLYCLTGIDTAPAEGPPYVRMENSWGPGWGHNGTARIKIDDLSTLFDGDCYLLAESAF